MDKLIFSVSATVIAGIFVAGIAIGLIVANITTEKKKKGIQDE